MGDFHPILEKLLLFAPPFILSLSFHEFAHAWAANRLGDSTAKFLGRMTIDPIVHISWLGTVIVPAVAIATGSPFLFGWANPVPVDMRNFRKPRPYMALVAFAGPASNIFLAIVVTMLYAILVKTNAMHYIGLENFSLPLYKMLLLGIYLNLILAFFNLIPIPPLDGSRVLQGVVNPATAEKIDQFAGQAQILLLLLLFTGTLRYFLIPAQIGFSLLMRIFNVPVIDFL
jgi:Zn-dependent protease